MHGLMRGKRAKPSNLLYPVYVFSGYASQGDYKEDWWVNHFCVVNATDGTIINTWLGY